MNYLKLCFLIEDDLDDQEIFCLALKDLEESIQCVCANDGVQALQILRTDITFVPDYIFIDLNMPRMNGTQCLQEIKRLAHLKNSEVIMYSTSSESKFLHNTEALGATRFLVKPPSVSLLSQALAKVFGQRIMGK